MIDTISDLVRKYPCTLYDTSNRGRPNIHSKDKLDVTV